MTPWNAFMENDFTIYLRSKVLFDKTESEKRGFIFARNGLHSGISTFRDASDNLHINFTYWFYKKNDGVVSDTNATPIEKTISYRCLSEEKYKYNNFIIKCNHSESKIWFYINEKLIGEIDYTGLDKYSYKEAYMWLGCGNMVTEYEEHKHIGEYEHDLFFCLNKNIELESIEDLKTNYKTKYLKKHVDLDILNDDTPFKDNILFFIDFNNKSKYKLWNIAFNGHYLNFYIENNTIY
jgi:hypothetical protein